MIDDSSHENQPAAADAPARAPATAAPQAIALPQEDLSRLTDDIIAALKTVYDPEIPSDIYELGLIYRIDIADDRAVTIDMTLTTPNCPSAQELPSMVENAVASVAGVGEVKVNIVWDPPWDPKPDVGRGARRSQYVVDRVPKLGRVLETCLYVDDLERAGQFLRASARARRFDRRHAVSRL